MKDIEHVHVFSELSPSEGRTEEPAVAVEVTEKGRQAAAGASRDGAALGTSRHHNRRRASPLQPSCSTGTWNTPMWHYSHDIAPPKEDVQVDGGAEVGGRRASPWSLGRCSCAACGHGFDSVEWLAQTCLLAPTDDEGEGEALGAVDDDEARAYLQLWHQRLGHPSMARLRQMYRRGEIPGPDIDPRQFETLQFFCPTCARDRQRKKGSSKKRKQRVKRDLMVLEEVHVDIMGPRRVESLRYGGERGNQAGGGNRYIVVYQDAATEYVFLDFIQKKSDIEASVERMQKAMEIWSNASVSFKGTQLKVKRWVSDRDSNLTSKTAVKAMMKERIEHLMTVAGPNNQTGLLDSTCRRLLELARVNLDMSGLTLPFWELAIRHAGELMNTFPTARHVLHHSPHERWTGEPTVDLIRRLKSFGAEVFPLRPVSARPNQSKLDPVSPGERGRFRYLGEELGHGFRSKGARYIDLLAKPPRMHVARDFDIDEDMDRVRELPLPKELFPGPLDGWDVPARKGPRRSQNVDNESKKEAEAEEVLREIEARDKAARKNTIAAWNAMPGDTRIAFRQENPKRGQSRERYERYKTCRTLGEYFGIGGWAKDLVNDSSTRRSGGPYLKILDGDEEPPDGFRVPEPVAAAVRGERAVGERGEVHYPADIAEKVAAAATAARATAAGAEDARAARRKARRFVDEHGEVRYHADVAEEAAVKRYAEAAKELHAYRAELGVELPEGIDAGDALLPYWEAAAAHGAGLEECALRIQALAKDFAYWIAAGVKDENGPSREERAARCDEITEMAMSAMEAASMQFDKKVGMDLDGIKAADVPVPKNYRDAMRGEFAEMWKDAVAKEMKNLQEHQVFKWVHPKPGTFVYDTNWAWKAKADEKGFISRAKARLVARGFRQRYARDYLDVMAPVGKLTSFRALLAEAAHLDFEWGALDVRSAYLKADLDIKQYVKPPDGVEPPEPGMVMMLERGLYGTAQGARCFHLKFRRELLSWGFQASVADPCLFVKRDEDGEEVLRVLLFVDDLCVLNARTAAGRALKVELKKNIEKLYEYSVDDAENMYIGMQVETLERERRRALFLHQVAYITKFMTKHGMMDRDGKQVCHATYTPAPATGAPVQKKDCPEGPPQYNEDGRAFREMVGGLRWVEQCSRPDISAALSEVSAVQSNPGKVHVERLMHLMRYVCTTREAGIMYGEAVDESRPCGPLVAYTDSDWSGDKETSETRGGYIVEMWQGAVSWSSFKIKSIAASSCESEYMASFHCVRETKWLRYLLSDMGYGDLSPTHFGNIDDRDYKREKLPDYGRKDERLEMPTLVCCDNQGTVKISANPVLHKRSKHIHLKYHLVRLEVNKRHVRLKYVNTAENLADLFTKVLPKATHEYLTSRIMRRVKDGVVLDFRGKELEGWSPRGCVQTELYATEPPGLNAEDMLTPDVGSKLPKGLPDRAARDLEEAASLAREAVIVASQAMAKDGATLEEVAKAASKAALQAQERTRGSRWELIYYAMRAGQEARARCVRQAVAASADVGSRRRRLLACARECVLKAKRIGLKEEVKRYVRKVVCMVVRAVASEATEALSGAHGGVRTAQLLRLVVQLRDAIVDSGASHTYVSKLVELWNSRQGKGCVWVANGRREEVSQIGDLGPLIGVRKVDSFTRTLVSVRDLVDQFGSVVFDSKGVHLRTCETDATTGAAGSCVGTQIGRPTIQRLYSFDVEALIKHAARIGG